MVLLPERNRHETPDPCTAVAKLQIRRRRMARCSGPDAHGQMLAGSGIASTELAYKKKNLPLRIPVPLTGSGKQRCPAIAQFSLAQVFSPKSSPSHLQLPCRRSMTERLSDYDYTLPPELIAQHPLPDRSEARLMVVDRQSGTIRHRHVADLPELLRAEDAIVVNDTRVVPAKLVGTREKTSGRWDGLFLDANPKGHWRLLSKTRGKLQPGERVILQDVQGNDAIALVMLVKLEEGAWAAQPVEIFGDGVPVSRPLDEVMRQVGRVPLPHYIRDGNMQPEDVSRYQTIYARHDGAVAAPTAGLHFTPDLMKTLVAQGVMVTTVTLHVGIGTFRPIQTEDIDAHQMHAEWCNLREEVVERLLDRRENGGRIVAVGTTSVRTLESASQGGRLQAFQGDTSLFIKPGHQFHATDVLMTNFHLPKSSLLVLVSAFAGKELIRQAYTEAIARQYRFFSYGDAMLIV